MKPLAELRLLRRFTVYERARLRELKAEIEAGELGGALDGVLSVAERNWLAFWAWSQFADRGVDPRVTLDPTRAQAILEGILERIEADGNALEH